MYSYNIQQTKEGWVVFGNYYQDSTGSSPVFSKTSYFYSNNFSDIVDFMNTVKQESWDSYKAAA